MEVNSQLTTDKALRDYQLVCRAREDGDQRAYADLMRMYKEPIYLLLLKMTNNPTEADDLTMEAFGKAFASLHLYTPTHAFSTWLFSIATNNCVDFIRKKRLQTIYLDDIRTKSEGEVYEYPIPSEGDNPEENIIHEQRVQILREVVRQLKPRYRKLVEMRYFEEMSYEEIAEELDMPLGTVKVQLFRARDLLYNILITKKEFL
ncbi:MAG: sigma-70 family RNA polymerase sigma factor [Bacteroidales bacterium]|jgi:RNA polymerase sigma-70 factor (ECF subfamily)|nr:sigma-70 family RNA polymerase sigma factor [Bacteroidales bacterium]